MCRFTYLFLLACVISHVALVGLGYPLIYEYALIWKIATGWVPYAWEHGGSSIPGLLMLSAVLSLLPVLVFGLELALFIAPAASVAVLYGLAQRHFPQIIRSLFALPLWTFGVVLVVATYLVLELVVTGPFPTPMIRQGGAFKAVPLFLHGLGAAGSLASLSLLGHLIKRSRRAMDGQAV